MDRKRAQESAARQLEERNKAYFAMAENLQKSGKSDEASRVRALCLSREPEEPGTFLRALLGPDVDDGDLLMIMLATDIMTMLQQRGGRVDGKVPVMGYIKACRAASSYFERLAKEFLKTDDDADVGEAQFELWGREAADLSERVEKLMDITETAVGLR